MAISGGRTFRASWIRDRRQLLITILIVLVILVLVPLLGLQLFGPVGSGVVSEIK
jgi:hypothetical protein